MKSKYCELLKYDNNSLKRRKKEVEFLIENKTLIFQNIYPNRQNYEIFVGCMEIYSETGVNYFKKYEDFMNTDGILNKNIGVEGYLKSYERHFGCKYYDISNLHYEYKEHIKSVVEIMEFFNIKELDGLDIKGYNKLIDNVDKEFKEMILEERKSNSELKLIEEEKRVSEYFSFSDFDEVKAERELKKCIDIISKKNNSKKVIKGKFDYTLDKSIEDETRLNEDETFIILFYSNDKIINVGYTEFLISYIGNKSKTLEFDSVQYCIVKKEYSKYVYIKSLMYLNLKIPSNTITISNEKFTTLNQAKRIYKTVYGLNLRDIKKVIESNDLEQYMISDSFILDKAELDLAIKNYMKKKN